MHARVLTFTFVLALVGTLGAASQEVSFTAPDGFTLKGTFHPAPRGGPGILLLHQCNADRKVYDNLATMLNTAGYSVLTVDFRGFGGSKAGAFTDFAKQRDAIVARMPDDVEAALTFMTSQTTVNRRALGVVGGSCGANQAVRAAARHPEIRTIVLLSGGTDAEGEAYIKGAPKVPIFGIASAEDTDAAAAVKKTVALSAHPDSRMDTVKDAGHAAFMFAKQPDLEADIVIWFRSNLPTGGYGLPPAIR
jgi:dienelactone hydrolase